MAREMPEVTPLILAGERTRADALRQQEGVSSKSDILIHGESMLARVLKAVRASGLAGPYHVCGAGETTRSHIEAYGLSPAVWLPARDGPASSVLSGLEMIGTYPVLVTTADHPLLSPHIIRHFIEASMATGADLTIGLCERDVIEVAYPDVGRTYFPVGGKKVSGCNLFLLASLDAVQAIEFWQSAEKDRKSPVRIARRFGLLNALRMMRPGVGFEEVFDILSSRLGCRVAPVLMPMAEAAIDVDKPDDLALVREILAARAPAEAGNAARA